MFAAVLLGSAPVYNPNFLLLVLVPFALIHPSSMMIFSKMDPFDLRHGKGEMF